MIKLTVYEFGEALVTKYTDRELHKEILGMSETEYKEYIYLKQTKKRKIY